jgi:hypothetical protein
MERWMHKTGGEKGAHQRENGEPGKWLRKA